MSETETLATIATVPWLASLGEDALAEVVAAGTTIRFRDGQALVRELEVGDSAYLILAGRALVTVEAGQTSPLPLGELRAGAACGELSLLTGELRSATVTARCRRCGSTRSTSRRCSRAIRRSRCTSRARSRRASPTATPRSTRSWPPSATRHRRGACRARPRR